MRTRFLNIDYFNPSSIKTLEALNFLHLPVPLLPPSNLSNLEDLHCFDSVLGISLDIERLPTDTALSKFFSDVLPQNIDVGVGDFLITRSRSRKYCDDEQRKFGSGSAEIRFSEKEDEVLYEEKEVESQRTFGSEILESDIPKKRNENTVNDKDEHEFEAVQFEMPQLDQFLENASFSEKEEMLILSEVPEIENNLDMLIPGLQMQYPYEVQESIYSVEDITSEYHMEQKAYLLEDAGSVQDQNHFHHCTFPLLEVDEVSLGILTSLSMDNELHLVLESIEPQHWTQKDDLMVDGKELLGSMDFNTLEYFSDHCLKQCLEYEIACPNLFLEMDFISITETSHIQRNLASHQGTSDGDSFFSVSPVLFQEFQILNLDSSQFFEVFFNSQTINEPETCDQMFKEDMNLRNFNEFIVSHELALVDDAFKSLPVPIFFDHENIRSKYDIVEETLAELKPQPLSASDGIYLDWNLLEEDKCNHYIYSTYQSMLEEVNTYSIDSDLKSIDDGKWIFDFVFAGDTSNGPNMGESKESLSMIPGGISMLNGHLSGVASSKLLGDGCTEPGNGELLSDSNAERVSLLFESMSQFNELDFFLNPRKATAGGNIEPAVKAFDTKATFPMVPSSDSVAACASAGVQLPQWDIKFHEVKLSDNILALMDNFQKSYLAILENGTELKKTHQAFPVADNFKLLSLPKQKLMDCIKKTSALRTSLAHGDENIMTFVTLCAIKQMAWYLCFYGIHTTHLYVDKLCRSLECLKYRLSFLQSLIEDAHGKAEKEITRSHPSLSVIQGILQSRTIQSSSKVLIVAEQVFWWSLKGLLTSMRISFNELQNFHTHANQPDVCSSSEFSKSAIDALLHSDCLLVSYKHVSESFPFNKFSIILEYGGSYGTSRISIISPKLVGLPCLHFLKVELEDFSVPKALCEGVDMAQIIGSTMEGESHSILALDENMNGQKLEELLNFVPIEAKFNMKSSEAADNVEACRMPLPVSCAPDDLNSKKMLPSMPSFSDKIIIVNTQNFDKEMIISRRSTYQKILSMEKEGAQVVERDLNLPVDLIISSAVCLVWYDCRNIGKKATTTDEASSCLPLCVENIATNVLTLLRFAFSGCILVFEGESSFLAAIMESSDGLYAAAASLGIDIQLFYSYSYELTDEIILNSIGYAAKFTGGPYPKMPESETLAESFLAKFPSINPLSAHAILSSGGTLVEFLDWSHDHRIRATRKYDVPEESITLFSSLCKYGEREDSKSGMTECSSSVSSAPESEYCYCKSDSERKKQKFIRSPQRIEIPMDDLLHFEPSNQFMDGGQNPSRVSKPYDSQMSNGPEILREIKKPSLSLNDKLFGQKQGLDRTMMNNLDRHDISKTEGLHENFIGEVIDLNDSSLLDEDFFSLANSISFSPLVHEMKSDPAARNSKTARRLSFGRGSHPTFPAASEINYDSDIWNSVKDHEQSLRDGINGYPDADFNNDNTPLKNRREVSREDSIQKSAKNFNGLSFQEKDVPHYGGTPFSNAIHSKNFNGLSFQEKDVPHYGGTPFSNAIHSAQPQQGSPWTIEFLNRIREKSRLRQQSLPCDTSALRFGYSGNIEKITKRKSPSILDFYKYQGGSTTKKAVEQKRQKRYIQPSSSSKNENTSAPISTWTPTDKRARQTLSFTTNGSGSQAKLVWGDGSAQSLNKRFRN